MKKNVLALSITAALVGIGFAGSAQAIGLGKPINENPIPSAVATNLVESSNGIGHFLYVPYYTAQNGNNTMINLVNTDTVNGKAVKVRFRGAANSDDVFDFQVFLSPGDVWAGSVTADANAAPKLSTPDASCTKPKKELLTAAPFSTERLDKIGRTGDALLNETREGYVEIFNMADIPPGSALFTAIKHVRDVAPCTGTAWTDLDRDPADEAIANQRGLFKPTSGLMGNWTIVNTKDAGAWSGAMTAITAVSGQGAVAAGSVVYFPQTDDRLPVQTLAYVTRFTADPFLRAHPDRLRTYDLPDFSIPYANGLNPEAQVTALNAALSSTSIVNEFLNLAGISATTDWTLSMPTRRYSTAYDYIADRQVFTVLPVDYFVLGNTTVIDRQVCITGISHVSYNQEETTAGDPVAGVVVSPQPVNFIPGFTMCGEASVLSFNQYESTDPAVPAGTLLKKRSKTLSGTVARSSIENGYVAGWTALYTPGPSGNGLPVIGYSAVRAVAAPNTYGATHPHRGN